MGAKGNKQQTLKIPKCSNNPTLVEKANALADHLKNPSNSLLDAVNYDEEVYSAILPSAVASLTGKFRSDDGNAREAFVCAVLDELKKKELILDYEDCTADRSRYDFSLLSNSRHKIVVESKGGEGNSVTLTHRPIGCDELVIWCQLTGAVQVPMQRQVQSIIGRLVKVMVNKSEQSKRYDVLVVWDQFCGTQCRSCPGAPAGGIIPCIYLFPQVQPTKINPCPDLHNLNTVEFPMLLAKHLGISRDLLEQHTWVIGIKLSRNGPDWYRTLIKTNLATNESTEGKPFKCTPLESPTPT